MTRGRQGGAVLLVVSLALATIAALAVGMNRAAGAQAGSVRIDYERRAAAYLAEAGVAAAKWSNQVGGCTSASVAATPLGAGSFAATVPRQNGHIKTISITGTGTVNGDTVRSLPTRPSGDMLDLSKQVPELLKGSRDITIDILRSDDDDNAPLRLVHGSAHALLQFSMGKIKEDWRVLSATLTLTPDGSNGVGGPVAVHRLTTAWDDEASWSWSTREPLALWNGGNYVAAPASTANVAGTLATDWNVKDLVDEWISGVPNHGMLLRLTAPTSAATVRFHRLEASTARQPTLRVMVAKPC